MTLSLRIKATIISTICVIVLAAGGLYLHRIFNNVLSERTLLIPGLEYEHRTQRYPYPVSMHILKVDPTKISIELALGGEQLIGTEKVSRMTRRHHGIAGINAGFFLSSHATDGLNQDDERYNGLPAGTLKIGHYWFKEPFPMAANLGWAEQGKRAVVGSFSTRWELHIGDQSYPVDHINHPQEPTRAILYSSSFHASTLTHDSCSEITIAGGKVTNIAHQTANSTIPAHGLVYSLGADSLVDPNSISIGQKSRLMHRIYSIEPDDFIWGNMDYILGGCGTLIKESNRATAEDLIEECHNEGFVNNRTARTAVGLHPDGSWYFVVVEGNIPGLSDGISLPDMAEFLEKKGCSSAINLSGASSSTLFLDGGLKNIPTTPQHKGTEIEGGEQPVGSAFILKPRGSKKLGDILVDLKAITPTQLSQSTRESYAHDQALGQFLLQQGLIQEKQLEDALEMKKRLQEYLPE